MKTSIHSDEKFRKLSRPQPNGQSLWQYLLSGPETTLIPGIVIGGRAGLAEALDWSQEGFDKAFQEILDQGMAKVDWKERLVWLPNGPKHNPPESPNVIIGWAKFWPEVPGCALKTEILKGLKDYIETLNPGFKEAFNKVFAKDLGESGTVPGTGTETGEKGSTEPASPTLVPVISLILNTGKEYPIYQGLIDEWQALYPAVDVPQELRNMRGWLDANPRKRKTKVGIKRFCASWLSRTQDKGGSGAPKNAPRGTTAPVRMFPE